MAEINILLIEDLETEIQSFKNSATRLGEENGIEFKLKNYKNLDSSLYKDILENKYDFVIIDLKLENGELGGNIFLKILKENLHIPIIINSANLADLDNEFNIINNPLVKQFNSGDPSQNTDDIFNYILKLHKTGLTKVLGKDGKIENVLNKLIWNGGLNNIEEWNKFGNEELSRKSLSRYILSHLHNDLSDESKHFHNEEMYLKNTGDNNFITGAILKKEEDYFIILTPACDIAQNKLVFYKIFKISSYPTSNTQIKNISKTSKYPLEKATNFLNGGVIDFENSLSIKKEDMTTENFSVVTYISPFFLKDIVFKLGNYYSRQGSPDLYKFNIT